MEEISTPSDGDNRVKKTNWKSIYIIAIVTFIASLEFASSNDWNYFCQLDSSATITFYGIMRTVGGLSAGIFTLIAGWICNKLRNTREVLISAKVVVLIAFCFFLGAELVHGLIFYSFFLLYKMLMGIAAGGGSMARTHVAMASTEKDRALAVALCSLFPAIGLLIGFLINAATSYMQYPGILLPIVNIHLNLFTAPMLFSMLIFVVAFYLLIFHFDGKWYNHTEAENPQSENGDVGCPMDATMLACKEGQMPPHVEGSVKSISSEGSNSNNECTGWIPKSSHQQHQRGGIVKCWMAQLRKEFSNCFCSTKFDCVAVSVCLFTQFVVSLAMLNILTLNAPFQQLAFQWDAAQLQFYSGLSGAAVAVQLIFWPFAYMIFGLNKIIPERNSVIVSLALLLIGYLFTYSWSFLPETIPYAYSNISTTAVDSIGSASLSSSASAGSVSSCGGHSQPGCPRHYKWCATTTKPNMYVFISMQVITTGMAMPILRMNLDILYSKLLGDIKQGVMQGLFMVAQSSLEMAGAPIFVSWIFEKTGPTHIWEFIGSQLALCLIFWLVFYDRMILRTKCRLAQQNQALAPLTTQKNEGGGEGGMVVVNKLNSSSNNNRNKTAANGGTIPLPPPITPSPAAIRLRTTNS